MDTQQHSRAERLLNLELGDIPDHFDSGSSLERRDTVNKGNSKSHCK